MRGNSDELIRQYMDQLSISYSIIGTSEADTACELFGRKLATPIMLGGMAHYERLQPGGAVEYAHAAKQVGTAIWTGMMRDAEFEEVVRTGAPAARIIKPFADRDYVMSLIEHDRCAGACAIAMDTDHVYDKRGRCASFDGKSFAAPTPAALRQFSSAGLPFFVKGVLSVRDALLCAEAGAAGIVVSNHQNLFPWCVPTLRILPEIRHAVGDGFTILCDSCLETGYDVFKALALGADGVFVVRHMIPVFRDEGCPGVVQRLNAMTDELRACLSRTASPDPGHIAPDVIQFCRES